MVVMVRGAHVVMGAMMMARGREGRGRNQHQHKSSENKLLHGLRVAPAEFGEKAVFCGERVGVNQERKQGERSQKSRGVNPCQGWVHE
jgi:hypothetical protein